MSAFFSLDFYLYTYSLFLILLLFLYDFIYMSITQVSVVHLVSHFCDIFFALQFLIPSLQKIFHWQPWTRPLSREFTACSLSQDFPCFACDFFVFIVLQLFFIIFLYLSLLVFSKVSACNFEMFFMHVLPILCLIVYGHLLVFWFRSSIFLLLFMYSVI